MTKKVNVYLYSWGSSNYMDKFRVYPHLNFKALDKRIRNLIIFEARTYIQLYNRKRNVLIYRYEHFSFFPFLICVADLL
jgi:hypothetical protein